MRLSYDRDMPESLIKLLSDKLGIEDMDSVLPGGRYRNFRDFISFSYAGRKKHEYAKMTALRYNRFDRARNLFEAIDQGDVLLYYPYHRFSYFTEFVRQAAYDPDVIDIKINLYRIAAKSRVVESLIDAARNNKNVTVNIELRARFDEEHNLEMTETLADAGVKVTLGIPGLKVHSKLCVVTRHPDGQKRRYAVIGTGNFNEKSAKVYTDFALFTCHQEICSEANSVFQFMEQSYKHPPLNHLWLSPINTRSQIIKGIRTEIQISEDGGKGRISLKLNNLADMEINKCLYQASQAGVRIRILVRSMCELRSGIEGLSENIEIISIVDRFLEHSRVFVFHNNGDPRVFISSADWMKRNLDQRVEVTCPVYDVTLKKMILDLLELQFADNQKARRVDPDLSNDYIPRGNKKKLRSQEAIYDYLGRQGNTN